MTFANAMRGRWKDHWSPDLKNALELALNTEAAIGNRGREVAAMDTLNRKGKAEAMEAFVDKTARANLRHVRNAVEKAKGDIVARRARMAPKKPTDPTAYLEAREIRDWLKSLDKPSLMKVLNDESTDPAVIAAAFTSPVPLPIDAEMKARAEERLYGPEFIKSVAEEEEAIANVEAALRWTEMQADDAVAEKAA